MLHQKLAHKKLGAQGSNNWIHGASAQRRKDIMRRLNRVQLKNGKIILNPTLMKAVHYVDLHFPQFVGLTEKMISIYVWSKRAAKVVTMHIVCD